MFNKIKNKNYKTLFLNFVFMLGITAKRGFLLHSILLMVVVVNSGCLTDFQNSADEGQTLFSLPLELKERYGFPTEVNEIESLAGELHSKADPSDPAVRNLARQIVQNVKESDPEVMKVQAIYLYVQHNWTYIEDSEGFDHVSSAAKIIESGFRGGSGDYSVLMASLLEAAGFKTRIVLGCDVDRGICRACPEVFIGPGEEAGQILAELSEMFGDRIYYTHDPKSGYWLSLDLAGKHIGDKPSINRVYLIIYPAEKRWEVVTG